MCKYFDRGLDCLHPNLTQNADHEDVNSILLSL